MGDELLYVCAQGYIMGNRQAAFTLLCDSCGEWYGQVQACVKDDALPHIDYEDKFPDDRTMSVMEPDEDDGEEDGEVEEFPLSKEMEIETGQGEAQGIFDLIDTESKAPTESPVSLLSQKHLFWFPPEEFNEPEGEREPEVGTKTDFSNGNNHIGVKTDFSESGTKIVHENEDFPIGPSVVNKETKAVKELVASTDESWLDGYPVTLDAVEEGEKIDSLMGLDKVILLATDQPNYSDKKKTSITTPIAERDLNHIVVSPTKFLNYGIKRAQVPLTPVIAPENGTTSKENEEMGRYIPTTEEFFTTEEPTTEEFFELPGTPPTAILETYVTVKPIDHIPPPTEAEETTTYLTPADAKTRPDQATVGFTETSTSEGASEGRTLIFELGGERLATSEPCSNEDCQGSSRGLLIAVVVTVLCLLLLSTVLAVWCYKKWQQKSSVYKLNGKGQTRHPQHIEMQKV